MKMKKGLKAKHIEEFIENSSETGIGSGIRKVIHRAGYKDLTVQYDLVVKRLSDIKREIDKEAAKIDWDKNTAGILKKVKYLESDSSERKPKKYYFFFRPAYITVTAIILAVIAAFFIVRDYGIDLKTGKPLLISEKSVKRIENTLAKDTTLDYLRRSDLVLVSVMNLSAEKTDRTSIEQNMNQAKELLRKKKYINRELESYELSKAQSVCDQVEFLLYDLLTLDIDRNPGSVKAIQEYIRDKKIMLKIKLVEHELSDKEV